MESNPIRATLAAGRPSLGAWLNLASPLAAEVMATAGFQWLTLDAEHSPFDLGTVTDTFRGICAHGVIPLVRTWDDDPVTLARLLDAGAWGLIIPHVRTPEQAERIARAMRYPPRGKRSAGTGRCTTLGSDYRERANDEILVIPQIEDVEGVDNAAAIAQVEGVDVGFLGPTDLSLDMGVSPGDPGHESAVQKVRAGFAAAGKPCGLPAREPDVARRRLEEGFLFLDVASDLRLLSAGANDVITQLT